MTDRNKHEELVAITKSCDLVLGSCKHTGKSPRNPRFVLWETPEYTDGHVAC